MAENGKRLCGKETSESKECEYCFGLYISDHYDCSSFRPIAVKSTSTIKNLSGVLQNIQKIHRPDEYQRTQ